MKPYQLRRIEQGCLALLLLAAAALRFAGLRWGLPEEAHLFSYHPDEAPLLGSVWYMLTSGDWDPHFYHYGTLYIYLIAVIARIGAGLGIIALPAGGWAELHLLGRTLTALAGVGAVYLVYLLGRSLAGAVVGLGAAALAAVLPALVINAHYATVDVPATALTMLLLVILVRFFGRAELGWHLLAGLVLGLAAATKYTMAIGVIPMLFAHFFGRDEEGYQPPAWHLIAALGVAVLAFAAVTPYLFVLGAEGFRINPDFLRDVRFEMEHMRIGGTFAFVNTGPGWVYHLMRSLPAGMGYAAAGLGVLGLALAAWRGGPVGWLLAAFALPYFGLIGAGKERFLRYTLPLLPVLAIAAAYALDLLRAATSERLGKRAALIAPALLGAGLLAVTSWYSRDMLLTMIRPDPRTRAAQWLVERAQPATTIGLASVPWYFTPPITPFNGGQRSRQHFEEWRAEDPPYAVTVIGWDAQTLAEHGPDYFVVSDAEYADLPRLGREDAVGLMAAVRERYQVQAFQHRAPLPAMRPTKFACPPDWLYTWPRIEVYQSREVAR